MSPKSGPASGGKVERKMATQISVPDWEILRKLIGRCRTRLLICSPWISSEGVERLSTFVSANGHIKLIEIWTRLAEVETDSSGLLSFARMLSGRGVEVTIKDSPTLHAKVFLADKTSALLGSANLTKPGFSRNPEIIMSTSDRALLGQIVTVLDGIEMNVGP
jgi:phosphatidylserine/phosphatidylglycerophosphate/cardiolipin synthase-like enzyme